MDDDPRARETALRADDPDFYPHALPIGTQITGYRIERVLGQGGFGITYRGKNPVTDWVVAIKEFFPHSIATRGSGTRLVYSSRNKGTIDWALDRFERSTRDLCRLQHPHIVKVINYVKENDTGYMIMEYVEGLTLERWLDQRFTQAPPKPAEIRQLIEPIFDAMSYVHGHNLIHRDVAPDNIMIRPDGRPILIDFGAMKLIERHTSTVAGMSFRVAKAHYSPPEQTEYDLTLDSRVDVYALGAVLYRAFAGAPPVDSELRKHHAAYRRADPYVPLANAAAIPLPPATASTIDRALSFHAEDRPPSIDELRAGLGWDEEQATAPTPFEQPERESARTTIVAEGVKAGVSIEPTQQAPVRDGGIEAAAGGRRERQLGTEAPRHQTVDVSQIVEHRKLGRTDVGLIVVSFALLLGQDFNVRLLSYAVPGLVQDWHATYAELAPSIIATAFGVALGAPVFGYASDRLGRKFAIVFASLFVGLFGLVVAAAGNVGQLALLRFLVGLGAGGLFVAVVTFIVESVPRRFGAAAIVAVLALVQLVETWLPAWVAALLLPSGWKMLCLAGAIVPILMALVALGVPESIRFLAAHGRRQAELAARLRRIDPHAPLGPGTVFAIGGGEPSEPPSLRHLFAHGLHRMTPMLWLVSALAVTGYGLLVTLVPTLRAASSASSVPLASALQLSQLQQIGGAVGALAICLTIGRFGVAPVLLLLAFAGPIVGTIGFIDPQSLSLLETLLFLAGCCSFGSASGIYAISAMLYPTSVRSTGAGLAFGIARAASTLFILYVMQALVPQLGIASQNLFLVAAVPFVLAAAACYPLMNMYKARMRSAVVPG